MMTRTMTMKTGMKRWREERGISRRAMECSGSQRSYPHQVGELNGLPDLSSACHYFKGQFSLLSKVVPFWIDSSICNRITWMGQTSGSRARLITLVAAGVSSLVQSSKQTDVSTIFNCDIWSSFACSFNVFLHICIVKGGRLHLFSPNGLEVIRPNRVLTFA